MRPVSLKLYPLFKYSVYVLLTLNIFLFFRQEWAAASHRFADGMGVTDLIEAFAATIDTTAWVVLLLMFELETWVLDDRQITPPVERSLHAVRALCMAVVVYAFYGYLTKLVLLYSAVPLGTDLCSLVDGTWAYAVDLDEYDYLTRANCAVISDGGELLRWPGLSAAVDATTLSAITRLGWTDVINAGVWIVVVVLLEFDVRLQERGRFHGRALLLSTVCKYVLYPILFLAAVYWGFKGDFVEFWDAFLWLVAFVFIELNLFEWRQEAIREEAAA